LALIEQQLKHRVASFASQT